MSVRARRVLAVAVLVALAVGAGAAWYVLGEARRTARLVASVLSARTGLPITVARAAMDGSRLRLWDVRFHPSPAWPLQARVREVEIGGGVLPLLAPAGRRLSVVAVSASITYSPANGPSTAASPAWPEALRHAFLALHAWPGTFAIRIAEGALNIDGRVMPFTITGDKSGDTLNATVVAGPTGDRSALTATLRTTTPDPESIRAEVELAAEPAGLPGLWPAALPVPVALAGRGDLRLVRQGESTAHGRFTVGDARDTPAVIDFTAGFDASGTGLRVSRYAFDWGADVKLEGEAALDHRPQGWMISGTARGSVIGSAVNGRAAYRPGSGAFDGELTATPLDARRTARALGLSPLPGDATARSLSARFSGSVRGNETAAAATLGAREVAVVGFATPVDATLDARLTFRGPGVRVATAEQATLTFALGGRTAAVMTAASRGATLWPMTVDVNVEDLGRLAPALPRATTLAGRARFQGEVRYGDHLEVRGSLEANAPRAEVNAGAPVVLLDVRAVVPVRWGVADAVPPGSVTVDRVSGWGLALTSVRAIAILAEERLLVSDIAYAHSGGRGRGWLEVAADGRATPVRARLEANGVDLAELVRESGWRIARITGRVGYVAAAQYAAADGIVATVRMESEHDGGEVSVDAVQRLLETSAVQVETTGVMRQTLENLRLFPYESLHADLRVNRGEGRLDLSLRGRKRLWLFPAAVEAINFRNVPLTVLARTFTRGNP